MCGEILAVALDPAACAELTREYLEAEAQLRLDPASAEPGR